MTNKRSILGLSLLVSFFSHAFLALLPVAKLDALFIPDDTYYVLQIAYSIADGHGPMAARGVITSGFQPLIVFLLSALFLLKPGLDQAVHWAVFLSSFFGVLTCCALAALLLRLRCSTIVIMGAVLFVSTAPVLMANHLNGIETSLSAFLILLGLCLLHDIAEGQRTSWRLFILGAVGGLAVLARIDNLAFLACAGLALLWVLCGSWIRAGRGLFVFASGVIVSAFSWYLYSWLVLGSIVPESGRAVRLVVEFYELFGLSFYNKISLAMANIGWVFFYNGKEGVPLGWWPIGFSILALYWLRKNAELPLVLVVFAGLTLIQFCFYVFYLSAFWFFARYFHLIGMFLVIVVAVTADRFMVGSRPVFLAAPLATVTAGLIVFNVLHFAGAVRSESHDTFLAETGEEGYAPVARAILADIPPGERLGAFQTGALTYYSEGRATIINLDGVVNPEILPYRAMGRLEAYLREKEITYIADWKTNILQLESFAGVDNFGACLEVVRAYPHQVRSQFTLYKLLPRGRC